MLNVLKRIGEPGLCTCWMTAVDGSSGDLVDEVDEPWELDGPPEEESGGDGGDGGGSVCTDWRGRRPRFPSVNFFLFLQ